jgi:hypothetical protein
LQVQLPDYGCFDASGNRFFIIMICFLTARTLRARMAREANRDMPTTRASAAAGDGKLLVGHSRLRLQRTR